VSRLPAALALAILVAACALPSSPAVPTASDAVVTPAPIATRSAEAAVGPETIIARASVARPSQPAMVAAFRPALVADHCVDRDLPAPTATDPALVILDRSYGLPAGYAPDDLVMASAAGLEGPSGTKLVRSVIVEDLAAMVAAWRTAGLEITIESAYRSYAGQAATFDSWVVRLGYEEALVRTARPGHSEHQLGTALDVVSPGWSGRVGDWAVESVEGAWMAAHAWEYGFVMSYPPGAQDTTCFTYEPWHYRWIGRDAAAAHRDSGVDLRRFLERYVSA
jgi:D-alanyl-D-alanine carboxypeptidase